MAYIAELNTVSVSRDLGREWKQGIMGTATARGWGWGSEERGKSIQTETLYHRDDALLYIAYVMLIWAAPIPADRWHCSLWP